MSIGYGFAHNLLFIDVFWYTHFRRHSPAPPVFFRLGAIIMINNFFVNESIEPRRVDNYRTCYYLLHWLGKATVRSLYNARHIDAASLSARAPTHSKSGRAITGVKRKTRKNFDTSIHLILFISIYTFHHQRNLYIYIYFFFFFSKKKWYLHANTQWSMTSC